MKYLLCIILIVGLFACDDMNKNINKKNNESELYNSEYTIDREKEFILISNNKYKSILSSGEIKKIKKYDNNIMFIKTFYSNEQLSQDQIFKFNNDQYELICETDFYQGNIYDFYSFNSYIIYSDYDPYVCKGKYLILDKEGRKTELDSTNNYFPQLYNYGNDVYYIKNDDSTKIIKYDIQSKEKLIIAEYPLHDIRLFGNKNTISWYYNNYYYVYKDGLRKIKCQNIFNKELCIDKEHLYASEKKDNLNIVAKYDINSHNYSSKIIDSDKFTICKDYIIFQHFNQYLSIYDKNFKELIKIKVENMKDIYVFDDNKCLITLDNNQYVEINIEDYL